MKGSNLVQFLETSNHNSEWPGKTYWVNSKVKPCKIFSESPCTNIPYSSDTLLRPLRKLYGAQGGLLLGARCLPWSPLLLNSNASILVQTFLWPHKCAVVVCVGGLFCTASSQNSSQGEGAHRPHAVSLGSPSSWEWVSGAQQCHHPYLMRDLH